MPGRVKASGKWLVLVVAVVAVWALALTGCDSGNPSSPIEGIFADLSGQITASRTLSADSTYLLSGTAEVLTPDTVSETTVLTIPSGTVVLAEAGSDAELIVRRGARLLVLGEANAPVVFTSSRDIGSRVPGDWRGLTIEGDAPVNDPTATFGGSEEADSSGILRYLRLEFAGSNGAALTLSGVGEATDLHAIQLHRSAGEGVRIEGGKACLYKVLVTAPGGTGVIWSDGWTGYGQFWVVQRETDGDGIAGSNGDAGDFAAPISAPELFNLTLIGAGKTLTGSGIALSGGTLGWIRNTIVQNFGVGLNVSGTSTETAIEDTLAGISHSILHGNGALAVTDGTLDLEATLLDTFLMNRTNDPEIIAPYDLLAPKFAPVSGSAAYKLDSVYAVPDTLGYAEWTRYLGAVYIHSTTSWIDSWTSFDPN